MPWSDRRIALIVLFAALALGAGIWIGEDNSEPISAVLFIALFGGGLIAYILTPLKSARGRLISMAAAGLVLFGGWIFGRNSAGAAFNDCVANGKSVRAALADYQVKNGTFPLHLDRLELAGLPGDRLLRASLLIYRRTPEGYELSFSDWLVTHRATETDAFTAWK